MSDLIAAEPTRFDVPLPWRRQRAVDEIHELDVTAMRHRRSFFMLANA